MQKTHRPKRAPTRKIAGIAGTNLNRSEIGTFSDFNGVSALSWNEVRSPGVEWAPGRENVITVCPWERQPSGP